MIIGIITNAQNASMKNSIAMLEEFLQEEYVQFYDTSVEGELSGLDIIRLNTNYIYAPSELGLLNVLKEGYSYYLIDKENLPENIRKNLKSGDCGIGLSGKDKYNAYSSFIDVYGVNDDLSVYYCSDGLESVIGNITLIKDDPTRVAIEDNETGLATFLKDTYSWIKTDVNGNVLSEGLESIKNLNLENAEIKDLSQVYNFSSLRKLTITNTTIEETDGLEYATLLTEINVVNSSISDYEGMGKVPRLEILYLYGIDDTEVYNLSLGFSSSTMTTLQYFGIMDSPEVTSINDFDNFSASIKSNIKYMYLYGNGIVNLNIGNGYGELYELYITPNTDKLYHNTTITSISLGNFPKLAFLYARQIRELKTFSILEAPKLYYLILYYNPFCETINLPYTEENGLSSLYNLNIQHNDSLINFKIFSTSLTSINFENCKAITALTDVYFPGILTMHFRYCDGLSNFSTLSKFSTVLTLNVQNNTNLINLDWIPSSVKWCGFSYCTNLIDISGLASCTNLRSLDISSTNVGKDQDVSYGAGRGYTRLTKGASNVFFDVFSNMNYFTALTATNCLYLGYITYLGSVTSLTYVRFEGDINISADEVASYLGLGLNLSVDCTWPRASDGPFETAKLSATSEAFVCSKNLSSADFENLTNFTNLKKIDFYGKIYSSDTGNELTTSEYNTCVNKTLGELTNLEWVKIECGIDEITFVKSTPKLGFLRMWNNAKVSTHRKVDGVNVEYDNGLKLLNTYCPNLYSILPPMNIWYDLSSIEPLVNKVSLNGFDHEYPSTESQVWPGILIGKYETLATLSKCTGIKYFCTKADGNNISDCSYDFSKCLSLEMVKFCRPATSYIGYKRQKVYLPNNLPNDPNYDGYVLDMQNCSWERPPVLTPSCKKLILKGFSDYDHTMNLWEYLSGLVDFSNIEISYLKEICIDFSGVTGGEYVCGDDESQTYSMKMLEACSNLEKISFIGNGASSGLMTSIDCLSSCTKLKEIFFENTNIQRLPNCSGMYQLEKITIKNSDLVDISGLSNCTSANFEEIDFYNNSIYDLRGLINLQCLTTANLGKNSIKNEFQAVEGKVDNVMILNNLRNTYNRLTTLYIAENELSDVSKLSWAQSV